MHVYFFHTTALFGLYGKDLKARRLSVVDEAQFSIFLFETTQNVAYQRTNYQQWATQGQGKCHLFVLEWLVHNRCSMFTEWVGLYEFVKLGCETFGIIV